MDTVDYAKATGLAAVLLCAACQFETRPLGFQDDSAPVTTTANVAAPRSMFDNPAAGDGMASAGSQPNGAPPAMAAPQPGSASPGPVAGSSADPGSSPDGPAAEPPTDPPQEETPPEDATPGGDPEPSEPDAGGASDAGNPPGPVPGDVFSACLQNTDCNQGLVCTTTLAALSGTRLPVGYCAAFCNWTDTTASSCPQPATGLVRSSCLPGANLCLLGSCDRSVCPTEMECVTVETPIGAGQVRTDHTCQP
jgi:hypothetical protein